jgi:hypothetical protein
MDFSFQIEGYDRSQGYLMVPFASKGLHWKTSSGLRNHPV